MMKNGNWFGFRGSWWARWTEQKVSWQLVGNFNTYSYFISTWEVLVSFLCIASEDNTRHPVVRPVSLWDIDPGPHSRYIPSFSIVLAWHRNNQKSPSLLWPLHFWPQMPPWPQWRPLMNDILLVMTNNVTRRHGQCRPLMNDWPSIGSIYELMLLLSYPPYGNTRTPRDYFEKLAAIWSAIVITSSGRCNDDVGLNWALCALGGMEV